MPKVIENAYERIVDGAKEVIEKDGYDAFTIRKVASSIHMAPSTIYNYFDSKEKLVGAIVLMGWIPLKENIELQVNESSTLKEASLYIFEGLRAFRKEYEHIFSSLEAKKVYMNLIGIKHDEFRRLFVDMLQRFEEDETKRIFITENLIAFSNKDISFNELACLMTPLSEG